MNEIKKNVEECEELETWDWKNPKPTSENSKWINKSMVYEAMGFSSMCWDSGQRYEAEKAIICANNLIEYISNYADVFFNREDFEKTIKEAHDKMEILELKNKSQVETIQRLQRAIDCLPEYEEESDGDFSADEWARHEEERRKENLI